MATFNPQTTASKPCGCKWKIVPIAAVLVIIVSIFMAVRHIRPQQTPSTLALLTALGKMTAQETAHLLHGQGQIVIVTTATAATGESGVAIPVTAFCQAIAEIPASKISVTIDPNPFTGQPNTISAAQFFDILEKHPQANAIVSFVGAPQLTEADIRRIRSGAPLWVVLNEPFANKLASLISRGVVQLAVISGQGATQVQNPKTAQEWFDRYYQVVTRNNLSLLQTQ